MVRADQGEFCHDQEDVLKKGQVRCTPNRRAGNEVLIRVNEARDVC